MQFIHLDLDPDPAPQIIADPDPKTYVEGRQPSPRQLVWRLLPLPQTAPVLWQGGAAGDRYLGPHPAARIRHKLPAHRAQGEFSWCDQEFPPIHPDIRWLLRNTGLYAYPHTFCCNRVDRISPELCLWPLSTDVPAYLLYISFSCFFIWKENCMTVRQCCGTVTIYYGSGSGSDFWKVMVPVPVPTFERFWFRFRFRFLFLEKLRFRFRFQLHI